MKVFWMVWREGGHLPAYQHETEQSARREAERLCWNNPGIRFVVLQSVASCAFDKFNWQETLPESPSISEMISEMNREIHRDRAR
jgi:hypothetical protein